MRAEDLRIGNWLQSKIRYCNYGCDVHAGDSFQVSQVHKDYVDSWSDMGASGKLKIVHVEPIPLTEEWLDKFGLIVEGKVWNFHIEKDMPTHYYLYKIKGFRGFMFAYEDGNRNFHTLSDLLYVHQLQNLYFALTGEELTIKDDEK